MSRFAIVTFAAVSLAPVLLGAEEYRDARVRYVENGVTLQRASEPTTEEALANTPVVPGDRLWTDGSGRIELQFADGSVVRVDSRSKLDFVSREEHEVDRVVLRLWSGSLILVGGRGNASFAVETPAGLVEAGARAILRVDFEDDETRLSVYDGEATLEGSRGRPVDLEGLERARVSRDEAAEAARSFDPSRTDDFDDWSLERESREAAADGERRPLPPELYAYADELEANGSWYYVNEIGNVWRPHVAAGWQPYLYGRWDWSSYGWVWVSGESWGWATSHYGRWGYSEGIGWYWIPGSVWSPAWVTWSVADDYIGWCPMGRDDGPVRYQRGRAVPRGVDDRSSWIYARKADFDSPDLARRRAVPRGDRAPAPPSNPSPHARPTRDLRRIVDGPAAVPRNINVKPTIGDFVPELAVDNRVAIPVRAPARSIRESRGATWDRTDHAARRSAVPEPAVTAAPRGRDRAPQSPPSSLTDPDREVLRRIFRPVTESQPNAAPHADRERERPVRVEAGRSATPRSEPAAKALPKAAPRPQVQAAPTPAPKAMAPDRSPHGQRSKSEN